RAGPRRGALPPPGTRMRSQPGATPAATAATWPAHPESSHTCAARATAATRVVPRSTPGAGHRRATGAVVAVRTATSGEMVAAARAGRNAAATVVTRPAAAPRAMAPGETSRAERKGRTENTGSGDSFPVARSE